MATQTQTGPAEPELESLSEDTSSLTVVLYLGRLNLNRSSPFSILDAEYIAASDATREAIWLRLMRNDTSTPDTAAIRMGCDNHGALKFIDRGIYNAKASTLMSNSATSTRNRNPQICPLPQR